MRSRRTDIAAAALMVSLLLALAGPGVSAADRTSGTSSVAPAGFTSSVEVKTGTFGELAEVVDSNGHVHLVAGDGQDIWYITDRTGSWTSRKVFSHTSSHLWGQPTIALDDNDRVHVASTRFPYGAGDIGIFYATDKGRARGTFGTPTRIAPNGNGEPQLKVFNNHLFLVVVKAWCCVGDGIVQLRTNVTGSWTVATIGYGQNPSFRMTTTGFARVAYDRSDTRPGIYFAVATTHAGGFSKAKIGGTGANDGRPILALKNNSAQIVWSHSGSPGKLKYTYATPSGWHTFLNVPGTTSLDPYGFDVTTTGVAHVASGSSTISDEFRSGSSWGSAIITAGADANAIAVRRGLSGRIVVAWTSSSGGVWVSSM